jgi:hypothetical protein
LHDEFFGFLEWFFGGSVIKEMALKWMEVSEEFPNPLCNPNL